MCGIAGIVSTRPVNPKAIVQMNKLQQHRGPDDSGLWFSNDKKVALGHRRLSIIDTSNSGHQPMINKTQVITFNGEIYNYLEIAKKLRDLGIDLDSTSDTEVLLKAYQQWGDDVLDQLNGMFAFAIYDPERQLLFCARDRFGEKPFLFHNTNDCFIFASEYKALFAINGISANYDEERILRFLFHPTQGLDDDVQTCFEHIKQLPSGHYLKLDVKTLNVSITRYWDITPDDEFAKITEPEAQEYFRFLLTDSIKLRMRSDVPLGSCLSGGLDSSAIVCLAHELRESNQSYDVFTGRFPGSNVDEWNWAKKIISATSAISHVVSPQVEDFHKDLGNFIWHNELPVGSTSQYAQWSVFRLAKQAGITVLLDGQGGDELLGGYEQYFQKYLASIGYHNTSERKKIKARYPLALLTRSQNANQYLPQKFRHFLAGITGKGSDFSFGLEQKHASNLHRKLSSAPPGADQFHPLAATLYQEMLYTHLPVLLRYGDRNSMAHSREVRLPFCDHRLAEFTFSLPAGYLMGGAETKRLLRGAMKGVLPEEIRKRWDKQGFIPPQAKWFQENLAEYAENVINDPDFEQSGVWRKRWWLDVLKRFNSGELHLASMLWRPVMRKAWQDHFLDRIKSIKKIDAFERSA
ncbi:MAG: asparagine synthase (glutamine-hydrolyzing) [Pseudomonadota bacterium]|nr:asparagine synthase (glutamine-hydrolyzing) [Pseudomonadota bacterium]